MEMGVVVHRNDSNQTKHERNLSTESVKTERDSASDKTWRGTAWACEISFVLCLIALCVVIAIFGGEFEDEYADQVLLSARNGVNHALQAESVLMTSVLNLVAHGMFLSLESQEQLTDFEKFKHFVSSLKDESESLQSLQWVPRVAHSDRSAYETHASALYGSLCTDPACRFTEYDGELSPNKTDYFPSYFVYPIEGNEADLLVDMASEPIMNETLSYSTDCGCTVASSPTKDTKDLWGLLVFSPLFGNETHYSHNATVEERRRDLLGFVVGTLLMKPLMEGVLFHLADTRALHITICDVASNVLVFDAFQSLDRTWVDVVAPRPTASPCELGGEHPPMVLTFTMKQWAVHVKGGPGFQKLHKPSTNWQGLFFTSVCVAGASVLYVMFSMLFWHHKVQEKDRLLEDLNAAEQGAKLASQQKGDFLAFLCHELRNPLHAIMASVDFIVETRDLDGSVVENVTSIKSSSHSMFRIVNDLLDMSKIEEGRMELDCAPVDLASLIEDAVRSQTQYAKNLHRLKLETRLEPNFPLFLSDPMRIRQILDNFLSNAVKFTSEGAVVAFAEIARDSESDSAVVDSGSAVDTVIQFGVIDTGVGIAPELIPILLQPYTQKKSQILRETGGTGLGLAIVARIVQILGGSLAVESEVGIGSTFRVILPVTTTKERGKSHRPKTEGGPSQGMEKHAHVLVVDDVKINRVILCRMIRKAFPSFQIEEAENGQEAMHKILAAEKACEEKSPLVPFDCVCMDVEMPVMNGLDATTQLRARGFTKPIIAVTASAFVHEQKRCFRVGINAILTKPFKRDELVELFEQHVLSGSNPASPFAVVEKQSSKRGVKVDSFFQRKR